MRETEEELKESQKRFIDLFNYSTSGIAYHEIINDAKGTPIDYIIKDMNPQYEKILSIKREDVINKKASELYKVDSPPYLDIYSKVGNTKESVTFETYFPPLEMFFQISVISPRKGEFITIFDDISGRKKSEQELKESEIRLKDAQALGKIGYWEFDIDTQKIIWSDQVFELYNRDPSLGPPTPEDEGSYYSPQTTKRLREYASRSIEDGEEFKYDLEAALPGGKSVYLSALMHPIKDKNGRVTKLVGTVQNITERKKAEQKLKESEKKYRKANERANLYKDLLTHDMNNIINVIQGSTEMYLSFKNNPEKKDELIEMISNSANKAKILIANVRAISQVEEAVDVSLKSVDVLNYLNDAIKFTHDSFKGKEVHIIVDAPTKNIVVQANDLLIDVFENILNNAVKYNNNPKVDINIRISIEYEDGQKFIKIEFIDNSIGISDARKKNIFQKGHIDAKSGKGLGFGLSVVKKLIEIYNGKIRVENRINDDYSKGSNFIILLPKEI